MNDDDDIVCVLCHLNRANITMNCCNKIFCDICLKKNLKTNSKCPNCRKYYSITNHHDESCATCHNNCTNDLWKIAYCFKNIRHTGCRCDCISCRTINDYDNECSMHTLCIPIMLFSLCSSIAYIIIFTGHNYIMSFGFLLLSVFLGIVTGAILTALCCGCLMTLDHLSVEERVVNV